MAKRSLLIILFLISISSAFAQHKDALIGKWLTTSGDAQILIYPSDGKFSGRIVWLKKPNDGTGKPETDNKNPDQKLAKRPILGLEMLKGFRYTEKGVWEDGTIYDPKTGRTYSCRISMAERDKINVRGYVGISMLGRTETWSRVR
ncbi:MAG: DUF2147 domain-containing protein [Daejeonella sp.]|uniref:DUF2147 domain-containing protein n=1 Tax=Daejeonella sp. JGW-45 TaxID=3034148 RepID=UPI0023EB3BA6|nr:DUF2147 domain-containing protein [Daejeonella sp. JGW-45]